MNNHKEHELTERQRFWLDHLRTCETAGKSIASYAKENGLSLQTMYTSKASLVTKGILPRSQRARFQRVQVESPAVASQWQIQLPNGVAIAFSGVVDASSLTTVLNASVAID